jgi:hypothetical protein
MKFLWALLLALLLAVPAWAQEKATTESADWPLCDDDEDCVIVGEGCTLTAVNVKYEKEADIYYKARKSIVMNCQAGAPPTRAYCGHRKEPCKEADGTNSPNETCLSEDTYCLLERPH